MDDSLQLCAVGSHEDLYNDCEGCRNHRCENSTRSMPIRRKSTTESMDTTQVKLDPHTLTFCRYRKRMSIACDDELFMREANMNHIRLSIGLYKNYPLAQALLSGAPSR